jgi:hypothetical protein
MIDVKVALQSARSYAAEVLGEFKPTVEEIEREEYKARDVWKITLGFPSDVYHAGRASLGLPSKEKNTSRSRWMRKPACRSL